MLATKNTMTARIIHITCFSKKAPSPGKERIVTRPSSVMVKAAKNRYQSTCAKYANGRVIPAYRGIRLRYYSETGSKSGITSTRPTAYRKAPGQVNTISFSSPASIRESNVSDAAKAFPAVSNTTATNEGLMISVTDPFFTRAVRRGVSEVLVTILLLTVSTD